MKPAEIIFMLTLRGGEKKRSHAKHNPQFLLFTLASVVSSGIVDFSSGVNKQTVGLKVTNGEVGGTKCSRCRQPPGSGSSISGTGGKRNWKATPAASLLGGGGVPKPR